MLYISTLKVSTAIDRPCLSCLFPAIFLCFYLLLSTPTSDNSFLACSDLDYLLPLRPSIWSCDTVHWQKVVSPRAHVCSHDDGALDRFLGRICITSLLALTSQSLLFHATLLRLVVSSVHVQSCLLLAMMLKRQGGDFLSHLLLYPYKL